MEIRRLRQSDEQAFFKEQEAYVAERETNPDLEPFGLVTDFSTFMADLKAEEEGLTNRPRTTCYYGFIDDEIAGHINCRWDLTPDLEAFGGHIGYMVVAKYRRQGVASQLLAYALGQYAGAGYERVLVTARVDNQASRATIEKAGGRLEDERTDEQGQTFARYWIELGGKMEIRPLTLADEAAFLAFNGALVAEREAGNDLVESKLVTDFPRFYAKAKALETAAPHPDWSPVTVYYAFVDGQVAGRISCRWELDKGDLSTVGGHVGYVTAPQFRRQGVMSALLSYAGERYRERGINRLFITALAHNLPSRATIEKAGGILQDVIDLPDGHRLARYWVDLKL